HGSASDRRDTHSNAEYLWTSRSWRQRCRSICADRLETVYRNSVRIRSARGRHVAGARPCAKRRTSRRTYLGSGPDWTKPHLRELGSLLSVSTAEHHYFRKGDTRTTAVSHRQRRCQLQRNAGLAKRVCPDN